MHLENDINIDGSYYRTRVGEELNGWYLRQWAGVNSDTGNPMYLKGGEDNDPTIVNSLKLCITNTCW